MNIIVIVAFPTIIDQECYLAEKSLSISLNTIKRIQVSRLLGVMIAILLLLLFENKLYYLYLCLCLCLCLYLYLYSYLRENTCFRLWISGYSISLSIIVMIGVSIMIGTITDQAGSRTSGWFLTIKVSLIMRDHDNFEEAIENWLFWHCH